MFPNILYATSGFGKQDGSFSNKGQNCMEIYQSQAIVIYMRKSKQEINDWCYL